ncbi:hypothetical protein [Pseudarthrobacter sp. NamB4]|uniref:hypothetical protein n=1 Tax=Pseudarthrobacter sp. NamB4 TaxID=2576837 RepID=UPI0010FCE63F|nr:hypothetical protein [Pseudarthrobacter sp. NamB4]TLM72937.1 hypothetical protein FDW81_11310 [Pseudarthrobacter sp. NamB4]
MPKKRKPPTKVPWYKRGKTLIIGAGALAAAILGVLNLWDRIFPPPDEDVARIESVNIIKRTPLTGFAGSGIGRELTLTPVPEGAGASIRLSVLVPAVTPPARPDLPAQPLSTDLPASTVDPPTPGPPTSTDPPPSPTGTTPSPTPTSTWPTSGSSPSSESPTPTGTATFLSVSPEVFGAASSIPDDFIDKVVKQPAMQTYAPPAGVSAAQLLIIEAVDAKGETLPPAQVAEELAQALSEVESANSPEGEDPLGWTVAVRVDLEGLAQVPLLLTWSLDGLDVPDTWMAENLAYRVVGASPHDAGVAEIWVPDLKRPGTYNVNIKLSYESTGLIADLHPLPLPEAGPVQGG